MGRGAAGGRFGGTANERASRPISRAGRRSLDFLKRPLLPYQTEGVLHLAFGERALLADDIGAREDRAGRSRRARLLPARSARLSSGCWWCLPRPSRPKWEEQIATFSDFPATVVLRAHRRHAAAAYARHTFFTLCNYEQIVDGPARAPGDVAAPIS